MRGIAIAAVVLFAVIALANTASAQYTEGMTETRIGIGVGVFHPIDSSLRDIESKWADIGITYTVTKNENQEQKSYLRFDWIADADSMTDTRMTPLTYNLVIRPNQNRFKSLYISGGLGVYPLRIKWQGIDASTTRFGCRIGAGVDLTSSSRLDLTYIWVDPWEDAVLVPWTGQNWGFSFSGVTLSYTAEAF